MNRLLIFFVMLSGLTAVPAKAELKIFACEPEWAALVQELGGDNVSVFSATTAMQDPHHIEARPSLIARLRQADLVVCTGAELESGWMPMLLRQAGNATVQPGQPGFFEAAAFVERLDVPEQIDRAMGDIHASGNPHIHTDPRRIAIVAQRLGERLAQLDRANASVYLARREDFSRRWQQALQAWSKRAELLKGVRVVSHHKNWVYLYDWLGLIDAGTLEAKPGIPPSTARVATLKRYLGKSPARMVLRTPFEDPRPSEWIARAARLNAAMLPYTVGGTPQAKDLYTLFDDTIARLLEAAR